MRNRHEVPTINLNERESPVVVRQEKLEDSDGTAFYVTIPGDYKFPGVSAPKSITEGDILPAPEVVKSFPDSSDEIIQAATLGELLLDSNGQTKIYLKRVHFNRDTGNIHLECDKKLPKSIINIIAEALWHEASINSDMPDKECEVSIRLQKPGHKWRKLAESNSPHFDGISANTSRYLNASYYVLSSAPGTVAYMGPHEKKWKQYRSQKGCFLEKISRIWYRYLICRGRLCMRTTLFFTRNHGTYFQKAAQIHDFLFEFLLSRGAERTK